MGISYGDDNMIKWVVMYEYGTNFFLICFLALSENGYTPIHDNLWLRNGDQSVPAK
jgi:hypothetical protein